jgi:hypothetical protein
MKLSSLAVDLLRDHAKDPARVYYDIDVLGTLFRGSAIRELDSAYNELAAFGFMESADRIVHLFGDPKRLFRITDAGCRQALSLTTA